MSVAMIGKISMNNGSSSFHAQSCFIKAFEATKITLLFVFPYGCSPRLGIFIPKNTLDARGVVLSNANILTVFSFCANPKIANHIVRRIAVDVIYLFARRDGAIVQDPQGPVEIYGCIPYLAEKISIRSSVNFLRQTGADANDNTIHQGKLILY